MHACLTLCVCVCVCMCECARVFICRFLFMVCVCLLKSSSVLNYYLIEKCMFATPVRFYCWDCNWYVICHASFTITCMCFAYLHPSSPAPTPATEFGHQGSADRPHIFSSSFVKRASLENISAVWSS